MSVTVWPDRATFEIDVVIAAGFGYTAPALAGFGGRPDLPAREANETAEWVEVLTDLLGNKAERQRLGWAGRAYAETHHNWNHCLVPFLDLLGFARPVPVGGR